jgi:hypothetical protein
MDGWVGGWVDVKAVLRIAYSNQKMFASLKQPIPHEITSSSLCIYISLAH